jgi:hypothetical protein
VRVGITLPLFNDEPERAVSVARRAEEAGLDGVFAFDHLWPLRQPHRPAMHSTTVLAAVALETSRIRVGTLVARVGLVPDALLVHTLVTVATIAGGRLVAGLGTGDSANKDENLAYGIDFAPVADRLASVVRCCRDLRAAGIPTWVGGRSPAVRRASVEAPADGWNGWGADPATFAAEAADLAGSGVEPTWAGQVLIGADPAEARAKLATYGDRDGLVWGTPDDLRRHFDALEAAGATWAVCAPLDVDGPSVPETLALVAAARR